jgi:hypothetical protein
MHQLFIYNHKNLNETPRIININDKHEWEIPVRIKRLIKQNILRPIFHLTNKGKVLCVHPAKLTEEQINNIKVILKETIFI